MSLESERRPKIVGTKLSLCALFLLLLQIFFSSRQFCEFILTKDSFLCYKRIVLKLFLSIALRLLTAHNFARD